MSFVSLMSFRASKASREIAYAVYIYILSSESGTLYVGMTNNLHRRMFEHQEGLVDGFTKKYNCKRLVYFETTTDVTAAIEREKQIKRWNRAKKEWLIGTINPTWKDLSSEI